MPAQVDTNNTSDINHLSANLYESVMKNNFMP